MNPLYFIVDEVDGSIEDKNRNKKYTKLWDGIKNLIEKINDKPNEYGKDFMENKLNSDDNFPLNKILKLHNLTIIVRSVFEENNKYYPQYCLDECLYELEK